MAASMSRVGVRWGQVPQSVPSMPKQRSGRGLAIVRQYVKMIAHSLSAVLDLLKVNGLARKITRLTFRFNKNTLQRFALK
jgi:hypothetical protein